MRKLSIFLMMLFLAFFGTARATVVEIGTGTTGDKYLPTYSYYNYSMTQQIYPACEIGMAGTIHSIAFHNVATSAKTRTLDVYFVLTDKTGFTGTNDWITVTAADLVFSGSVTFPESDWVTLTLNSPFNLDGRKNLAVIVDDNTGSYSSGLSCAVFDASSAALRAYSDGTNFNPMAPTNYTGTVMNVKNCIRLDITEDPSVTLCCPPDAISVPSDSLSLTAHEAVVIWEGGNAPYTLEYKTTDETTWTSVQNISDTTYTLTGLIQNTTYQARVQSGCGSIWVTSSNFTTLVSVQTPTDLVCTSTTTTDATLQWQENGVATSWIVAYKVMTDTVFTEVSVNTNPYTITGLAPSTYYTAKVCAVKPDRENSSWSNLISFATDCVPFSTLPWNENFDSYTTGVSTSTSTPTGYPNVTLPICWQFLNRSENSVTYPQVFLYSSSTYAISGNCLFFKSKAATSVYAILPEFTDDITDLYLSFTYRNEGTSESNGTLYVGYMTNPTDSTSFIVVDTCAITTTKTEKECGFAGAPSGSYMAFRYTGGTGSNYYLGIDNVIVTTLPTCIKPSVLAVSDVTNHTAKLSWTENGEATTWQICLNDDENNLIDADSVPFVVSGLDAETQYTAKVRANCGGNDGVSEWCSISLTFTTAIACVAPTSLIVSNITNQGATLNWSNDAGKWVVAYKADTDEDFTEITGITTKPYILTGLDPETHYTVKVKAVCGGIDGESLYSYLNSFTTLVACPAPKDLLCTGVTPTTATFDWTERGDATAWELCLNSDSTNLITVSQKPYTIENLTAETTYTVAVRSACGGDWSSTISFEPTVKLVIGLGNGTNNYLPTNTLYNYSLTQQIYTVEELGEEGVISSIDFYCNGTYSDENVRTIDIYMVNTDKSSFANDTDWITVTAADKVFSSETFSMSQGWNTFQLNCVFIYDGTHNIALIVDDNTGVWNSGPAYLVTDAPSQAIYAYADNTNFDPLTPPTTYSSQDHHSKLDVKNQIRLMKNEIPDCMPVSGLTVNVAGNTAVVSWGSVAEAWNMLLNGEPVHDNIANPYTLSDLEYDSTYTVQVQAVCTNGLSDMMSASFTTEHCAVEDQCAITFTLTDSYGDGWNAAAIVVSNAETGEVMATLANENLDGTSGEETQIVTLSVCDGDSLHFAWTSGSYDSETSYSVTDANGHVFVSGVGSGFEEFDCTVYCSEPCPAPTALTVAPNANFAELAWEGTSDSYIVQYRTAEGEWITWEMNNDTGESIITGLTLGIAYEARVQGVCPDVEESYWQWSEVVPFTTSVPPAIVPWGEEWSSVPTINDDVTIYDDIVIIGAGVTAYANSVTFAGNGQIIIEDGGFFYHNDEVEVSMQLNVTGYNPSKDGDNAGYCLIAPGVHSTEDNNFIPVEGTNLNTGTFDLYYFDESKQELQWINYKQDVGTGFDHLTLGTGYLYANKENLDNVVFRGFTLPTDDNFVLETGLYYSEGNVFAGYNLVGNPFTCNAYVKDGAGYRPYYVLNTAGNGLNPIAVSAGTEIAPMKGVFVKATADDLSCLFTTAAPSKSPNLNIVVNQNHVMVDNAIVSYGNSSTLEKLQLNPDHTKVYMTVEGKDYAVAKADSQGAMPVSFKAEKNGTYTMSFINEEVTFSYLHLIDNLLGNDVNLLESPSYSFDARTTDYASRFKLVFATGNNSSEDNFGFLSDGNLMILGIEGEATLQVIDVNGRILSTETFSGSYTKAINEAAGVYMLRLIQGNDVRTQKIVIQ